MIPDVLQRKLALAQRHLDRANDLLVKQRQLSLRLRSHGQDTALADALLELMKESCEAIDAHKLDIELEVNQVQSGSAKPLVNHD
jgi:hypothetical protein